jgi:hypothetical protein
MLMRGGFPQRKNTTPLCVSQNFKAGKTSTPPAKKYKIILRKSKYKKKNYFFATRPESRSA